MNREEFVRFVENLTLCENEGHAIFSHINKDCRFLKNRAIEEKTNSSAFLRDVDVLKMIQEFLLDDYCIEHCLAKINSDSATDEINLENVYDENIGYGFKYKGHSWNEGVLFTNVIKIVLKRTYREKDYGVKFVTAYPLLED